MTPIRVALMPASGFENSQKNFWEVRMCFYLGIHRVSAGRSVVAFRRDLAHSSTQEATRARNELPGWPVWPRVEVPPEDREPEQDSQERRLRSRTGPRSWPLTLDRNRTPQNR